VATGGAMKFGATGLRCYQEGNYGRTNISKCPQVSQRLTFTSLPPRPNQPILLFGLYLIGDVWIGEAIQPCSKLVLPQLVHTC
jgi:hypothetical protein